MKPILERRIGMDNSDDIRKALREEIMAEFDRIKNMADGEEKERAIKNVVALYELDIKDSVNDNNFNECLIKDKMLEVEQFKAKMEEENVALKKQELWNQRIEMGVKIAVTTIGVVAYSVWLKKCLIFEETGSLTSPETKNIISKGLPKLF